jgi:hypothetical protein
MAYRPGLMCMKFVDTTVACICYDFQASAGPPQSSVRVDNRIVVGTY